MKRVALYTLTVIALISVALIVWRLSEVIVVGFSGVVGAVVLRTLAMPISNRFGIPKRWSLGIVLVTGLTLFGLLCVLFGNQVAKQAEEMQRLVPESATKITEWLNGSSFGQAFVRSVKSMAGDSKMLSGMGSAAGAFATLITGMVLIFFLSIYFAFDPREYREGMLRLLPPTTRPRVRFALESAGEALRKWLVAQLVAMVIVGVLVGVSLALLGIPLALLLGALAAVLEFIPIVGPVLFTIPGLLVAFTKGPAAVLYALIAYVVVQQLESNIIIPLLQRWALRLPPVVSLLSVIACGILFGPLGAVVGTPLALVVITLVQRLYIKETIERPRKPEPADLPAMAEPAAVTRHG